MAADTASVVSGNNQFAFDLYAKLAVTNWDDSFFFSPYSISTALGMTWAGARGNTESQMAQVLHFEANQAAEHAAFSGLQSQLNAVQEKQQVMLNIANGLWAQQDQRFLPAFLNLAQNDYGAKVEQVDFRTGAEGARKEINGWVGDKTSGRVKELVNPNDVNEGTRLVLVNAIYFKGQWQTPFKVSDTQSALFMMPLDASTSVKMMNQIASFNYAEADGLQLLELPYAGGDLSVVVLLPRDLTGPDVPKYQWTAANLNRWLALARKQKVNVFLPKFKLTSEFTLGSTLREMGMTNAFTSQADFSGMDGGHDLFISEVIHKAFVEVNEEGSEAAAATAVTTFGAAPPPGNVALFRADHPFIFVIRDVHSGGILFFGQFTAPTDLVQ
jgi:serpin B